MAMNSVSTEVTTKSTPATDHTTNATNQGSNVTNATANQGPETTSKNTSITPEHTSSGKVVGIVLGLAAIVTLMLLSFLPPAVNSGAKTFRSLSVGRIRRLTNSLKT